MVPTRALVESLAGSTRMNTETKLALRALVRTLRTTGSMSDDAFDAMLRELVQEDDRRGKTGGQLAELARYYRLDDDRED
jgi:hypothetical protein